MLNFMGRGLVGIQLEVGLAQMLLGPEQVLKGYSGQEQVLKL